MLTSNARLFLLSLTLAGWIKFTTGMAQGASSAARLRVLLDTSTKKAVALPGVHDALSAKIYAQAGAKALFVSGFGVSACRLGEPDVGILTYSEMEDAARNIIKAVDIPVIVDGDTGFGGAANIRRTVRGFAAAGAAAVTIEDQQFPKRCTFAAGTGVRVVSRDESLQRIQQALAAREEARKLDGNDILVIARTDCRAALGLEEAIERCKLYEKAGADIVYAENLRGRDEYIELRTNLQHTTPSMLAQVQLEAGSKAVTIDEIGAMGYSLGLYGVTALQSYVSALQTTAKDFFDNGGSVQKDIVAFPTLKAVVGFDEIDNFESRANPKE